MNPYRVGTAVSNDMRLEFRIISHFTWVPSTSNFKIYGWIPETAGLEEGVYTDTVRPHSVMMNPEGCSSLQVVSFSGGKTVMTALQVRVVVKPFCALDVSQHIDFGSWQDLDQPRDQEGSVTVTCDKSTKYSLKLGWGAQGQAGTTRNMANGGEKIAYNLFSDTQRNHRWGDENGGEVKRDIQGDGNKKTFPVYARFPKQKTPSPGTYTDNVVVTLEYQ